MSSFEAGTCMHTGVFYTLASIIDVRVYFTYRLVGVKRIFMQEVIKFFIGFISYYLKDSAKILAY